MSQESLSFLKSPNTERQMQRYPKMVSRLGQHLLRAKSKTENFGLFALYLCYFLSALGCAVQTFGCYWGNSLAHPMLITVSGLSILAQKWLGGVRSLHVIECPVGFNHNAITHLATHLKLQEMLSPDLHPVFPKSGNISNIQSSSSLTL